MPQPPLAQDETEGGPPRHGARAVAFQAICWTAAIAAAKLVVGALSGSVAVLGDGLHSALDVALSGLTFFAVRLAGKPPDATHPFGHGRAENLAALAEAVVMGLVAVGVALEATRRLLVGAEARAPWYAIAVTAVALIVGYRRALTLRRAAKRFSSPALEADAANVTADVVESVAVLGGLLFTRLGWPAGDPIAAIVVVLVMWLMAVRIGWSAVNVLMERAPADLTDRLSHAAGGVEGVVEVGGLRVRQLGADVHAEVTVRVGRTSTVAQSHEITEAVEAAVAQAVPGASATVHVEPSREGEDIVAQVFAAANRLGLADQVHNVFTIAHPEGLWLMLHAKVPAETTLGEAHRVTDDLEHLIRAEVSGLARVEIHLEPRERQRLVGHVVSESYGPLRQDAIDIATSHPPITGCHEVAVTRAQDGLHLVLHCDAAADAAIGEIHDASLSVESEVHRRYREVRSVTVHFEPTA